MNRTIAVLGSTGSIGTQTLEIAAALGIQVAGLSAGRNASLLASQIARFHPRIVSVADASVVDALRIALDELPAGRYREPLEILYGDEGNRAVAELPESNLVVAAMVGIAGLGPVLSAIRANKDIALANKETLVAGGSIVMPLIEEHKVHLLPVDSEHCHLAVPVGQRREEDSSYFVDSIRRTVSPNSRRSTCTGGCESCLVTSDLADGRQNHNRLRDHDEQRTGGHRSLLVV